MGTAARACGGLGYSRLLWLRFYARQTMNVLIDGLESAFARFGGVPKELLFDQMRSVVLSNERAGGRSGAERGVPALRGALAVHAAAPTSPPTDCYPSAIVGRRAG